MNEKGDWNIDGGKEIHSLIMGTYWNAVLVKLYQKGTLNHSAIIKMEIFHFIFFKYYIHIHSLSPLIILFV